MRWLQAVSTYKATHSGGPNFAYDLCASRVTPEQRSGLDLGAWSVAFNGAEPVRQATFERFAETFGPCGFRAEAFAPGYGLAEATLMVSFHRSGAEPVAFRARRAELERNRVAAAAPDVDLKNGVEQELGVSVPLIHVIQGPTVAELAATLLGQIDGSGAAALPSAPAESTERGKALSPWISVLSLGQGEDKRDA